MDVLFVASELFPFVKVGGLGDVMAALPRAMRALGADVRLLLPAYPAVRQGVAVQGEALALPGLMGGGPARLLRAETPGLPLYLLDQPAFFDRPGNPYGHPWDAARRFAALAWAAAELGRRGDAAGWRPAVVHGHDWPTGLMPAYVAFGPEPRPATVMTIHNIAYPGRFPLSLAPELGLPPAALTPEGVEFHGDIGFLKAGLRLADRLTTVSPTYAQEVQRADGHGLEGLLAYRAADFRGILNGVDKAVWNPATDPALASRFDLRHPGRRVPNRAVLQRRLGLQEDPDSLLCAAVSRLDVLKGLDLVLENIDHLVDRGGQLVLVGSGDPGLEQAFRDAEARHPGRVGAFLGYDETLARLAFAGSDVVLVPSRQEPCGLTQLYAQAYGALPLVRRTGGLADTVVGATPATLADRTATGFCFEGADGWSLGQALDQAFALKEDPLAWRQVQRAAMQRDFGWEGPARETLGLYATIPSVR